MNNIFDQDEHQKLLYLEAFTNTLSMNILVYCAYKDNRNTALLCLQDGPWLHENLDFEAYPGKRMRVGTCDRIENSSKTKHVKNPQR